MYFVTDYSEMKRMASSSADVLFSIVVPIYNSWGAIDSLIESLLNQSFKGFELVLVDDGSTESPDRITRISELDSFQIIYMGENSGPFYARREGVYHARGKYIVFLDSDDHLSLDYLLCLRRALAKDSADVIISSVREVGGDFYQSAFSKAYSLFLPVRPFGRPVSYKRALRIPSYLGTPGKSYRRDFLIEMFRKYEHQYCKFDLRYAEDVYLFYLCCMNTSYFLHVPKSEYYYIRNASSLTAALKDNDIAKKKRYHQDVIDLIRASRASSAVHSLIVARKISTFFENQVIVDSILLERWLATKKRDNVYFSSLWRVFIARRGFRDFLRFLGGSILYLVTGEIH